MKIDLRLLRVLRHDRSLEVSLFNEVVWFDSDAGIVPRCTRWLVVRLPRGYEFEILFALNFELCRWRTLANGDKISWSETVAPDDWRNQPTRPNGIPW